MFFQDELKIADNIDQQTNQYEISNLTHKTFQNSHQKLPKISDCADNRRTKIMSLAKITKYPMVYPFPLVLQETRRCFLCSNDKISYERIFMVNLGILPSFHFLCMYIFPRLVRLATAPSRHRPTDQWILFARSSKYSYDVSSLGSVIADGIKNQLYESRKKYIPKFLRGFKKCEDEIMWNDFHKEGGLASNLFIYHFEGPVN